MHLKKAWVCLFTHYIKEAYVVIGAVVLVFINILILWISILRVSSLRKKSDLKAAEVIGKDVQEAYNFGMLGLVVTDDNDIVLWTNTLFTDRKIEIINTNILDWHKDLLPLKDPNFSEESVKIIINSRNYEVKFLSEAGLWIFKDITDYESIYSYSVEQAPVVGILAIDNYDDVVKGDEDFNCSDTADEEGKYYVAMYAVAVGRDSTFQTFYSNILYLGSVTIDGKSENN